MKLTCNEQKQAANVAKSMLTVSIEEAKKEGKF